MPSLFPPWVSFFPVIIAKFSEPQLQFSPPLFMSFFLGHDRTFFFSFPPQPEPPYRYSAPFFPPDVEFIGNFFGPSFFRYEFQAHLAKLTCDCPPPFFLPTFSLKSPPPTFFRPPSFFQECSPFPFSFPSRFDFPNFFFFGRYHFFFFPSSKFPFLPMRWRFQLPHKRILNLLPGGFFLPPRDPLPRLLGTKGP